MNIHIQKQHKNLDSDLILFTINSKLSTDLDLKHGTIKCLEDNVDDLWYSNVFLDITSKVQFIKERIDKLNFIKRHINA